MEPDPVDGVGKGLQVNAPISIRLNGEIKHISRTLSLADLLQQLELNPQQVAVARNLEVIVRSELANTTLQENDEVEIFHAVGGG